MNGYIDADVAYFLGLVIGRGEIIQKGDTVSIDISFPFKTKIEGIDQFSFFVTSITSKILPRLEALIGKSFIRLVTNSDNKRVSVLVELPRTNIIVRNLFLLLDNRIHYSEYKVPDVILRQENLEIVKEFMRGFGDVSANIRRSNRDQNNLHRVYVDILFRNWYLPVQICYLLQEVLNIPVSNIIWGHPNIRGDNVLGREHQIRIYAHEYLKLGFYIEHKQVILEKLAKENMNNPRYLTFLGKFCRGYTKRYRRKPVSSLEKDEVFPPEIRGKHFNTYWEICAELGCERAKNYMRKRGKT